MKQDKVRAKDEPNSELAQSAPQYTDIQNILADLYGKSQIDKINGEYKSERIVEATTQLTTLLNTEAIKQLKWAKELTHITNDESWHEAIKDRISELKEQP